VAKVAILGVGKMGAAMAKELSEAEHEVILWNRTIEKAELLAKSIKNAKVAKSVIEAVAEADIALCLLVSGAVTEQTFFSDPEVLRNANRSIIIVDMGTSGVQTAHKLNEIVRSMGLRFVDAPVSGSIATIAAHQLLVMASGDSSDILEIEPILLSFSKKVFNVGEVGNGQTMKLAVNLIVHLLNAAVSESISLATRAGVELEKVYEVFDESVIAAPFVKYKKAAFLDPSTPVAMRVDTVVKDLGLITEFGARLGLPLVVTETVSRLYRAAEAAGAGAQDMATLARFLQDSGSNIENFIKKS
jgi:3-hydroxyisobutyrate dehydrogenase